MPHPLQELKEKDFAEKVGKGKALIEFWAPWCHACKMIEPSVEELAQGYKEKMRFFKVNVVDNPGLASKLGVMSLPNILFFTQGKVKDQIVGASAKSAIETKIKSFLK